MELLKENIVFGNNFFDIRKTVNAGEPGYLTIDGYGAMVVLSLEAYSRLTDSVESASGRVDRETEGSDVRISHYAASPLPADRACSFVCC